jgi:CheY-like chemotaxis protein
MDFYTWSTTNGDDMSKKLLLADDDCSAIAAVALFFESQQFEVQTALDGITALHLCAAWHPDAAFLDIDMPGASGYEVAREIRHMVRPGKRTLLVAVTGERPADEVASKCRAAGFDLHVAKPADLNALLHFVVQRISH